MLDGTIRVFLAEALFPLTGILTAAFLTRRLGPDHYGLLIVAATLVFWVEESIDCLLSRATVKLVGQADDWKPIGLTIMRYHAFIGCGAGLVLYLVATHIAALLQEPVLAGYLGIYALDVPIHAIAQAHRNILDGIGAFRHRALASALRWTARLLFIVILVELGLSVPGAILANVGASLVELIIARCYVRPALFRGPALETKKLWVDAIPLFFSSMSLALFHRMDLVMLKMLGGTAAQAGFYGSAQNLSIIPGIFAMSFSPLLLSTLSRVIRAGDSHQAKEIVSDSIRLVIVLLPFAGMTAGMAHEIVVFIFGPLFAPAAPLFSTLIFGALGTVMISVASAILIAAGKPNWTIALAMPLVPLALVGHGFLIPPLGAVGASIVTTSLKGLGALVAVLAVYRLWRILPPSGTLARSCLISGVTFMLALVWPAPGLWLFVKVPAIVIFICVCFIQLGEFSANEIAWAGSLLKKLMWQLVSPSKVLCRRRA